jgi:hypothetical protein
VKLRFSLIICGIMTLGGCASTSGVMEMADGSYMISAKAAPIRGGTSGANSMAYDEAQKFCSTANGKAVIVNQQERDVYQGGSAASVNQSGGFGSSGFAAGGAASIRFRCVK